MSLAVLFGNDAEYLDRSGAANSADPDQTAPKEQSDQGLHCLIFRQLLSDGEFSMVNFRLINSTVVLVV